MMGFFSKIFRLIWAILGSLWSILRGKESIFRVLCLHYLRLTRKPIRSRFPAYDFASNDLIEFGLIISNQERELEHRRFTKEKETDSVFLFGVNSKNEKFMSGISIDGSRLASAWFHLSLSDGTSYKLKNQNELLNVPKTSDDTFVYGGLRMRCLIPMRKWKISYNGLLRERNINGIECDIHVRLCFIWSAVLGQHDLKTDISSSLWASFFNAQKGFSAWNCKTENYDEGLNSYVQGGNIIGNINVEGQEIKEIQLWGLRKRNYDLNSENRPDNLELMAFSKEGHIIHAGSMRYPYSESSLNYGYAVLRNSLCVNMNVCQLTYGSKSTMDLKKVKLSNDVFSFEVNIGKSVESFSLDTLHCEHKTELNFVPFNTKDDYGLAVLLHYSRENDISLTPYKPILSLPRLNENLIPEYLVVSLSDLHCQNATLTGGKGSSLGSLSYLKSKIKPEYFVPKGITVTTFAYAQFEKIFNISKKVQQLENIAWKNSSNQEIEEVCKSTVDSISGLELPLAIQQTLVAKLHIIFGAKLKMIKFAVRSSSSGEDSEEMSAAGQMETFLGVQGLDNIMKAVVRCWASQFAFTAIQYKKQNGQLLNMPMAVVVQEMVDAEVAGVMFTRDPMTGNPSSATITANYGLGESVVSATAEPDTLVFEKDSDNNSYLLKSSVVGQKRTKTVLAADGGVVEETVDDEVSKNCSLSLNHGERLCQIVAKIEEAYGCPLDVEWAVVGQNIYLLQARPITTLDRDTEFDTINDSDSSVRCEDEYLTRANIGEVWNGNFSPLGASVMLKMNNFFARQYFKRDVEYFHMSPYSDNMVSAHKFNGFINVLSLCLRFYKKGVKSFVTESIMISGFGRLLTDEHMLNLAEKRNQDFPPSKTLKSLFFIVKDIIMCKSSVIKATEINRNKKIAILESDSSKEALRKVLQYYVKTDEPFRCHLECTSSSSFVSSAILYVLVAATNGEWTSQVFNDFAKILSSGTDVLSADVPKDIEKLAKTISESKYFESFRNMSKEEASHWLKTTESQPGIMFQEFIATHGHRCLNEFDFHQKPWRQNILPLVESLQQMVGQLKHTAKKTLNTSETIASLTVPLNWKSKLLLRFLIPLCRRAVGCRELSKSLFVYNNDITRKGFEELAKKMVNEGRLPEGDLIYFLNHLELEMLIENRSSRLVQKAIKRRAVVPKLSNLKYAEITKGLPSPEDNGNSRNLGPIEASFTLKGTPVSEGVAKGVARVAVSLEDAKLIQPGEILIARGTDIGWSPYFPMLAGVATELGGLVSHGAVVAREYGLPCVVGVHGATDKFKSGDLVVLDGNKGLLQKIEP